MVWKPTCSRLCRSWSRRCDLHSRPLKAPCGALFSWWTLFKGDFPIGIASAAAGNPAPCPAVDPSPQRSGPACQHVVRRADQAAAIAPGRRIPAQHRTTAVASATQQHAHGAGLQGAAHTASVAWRSQWRLGRGLGLQPEGARMGGRVGSHAARTLPLKSAADAPKTYSGAG